MIRRRDVLIGSAALGALGLDGCGPPALEVEAPASAFPLGVASGEVSHSRAVLWTRYVGPAPALRLSVYVVERDSVERVVVERRRVELAEAGFVHVEVDGLTPGALCRYVFEEDGGLDPAWAEGAFRAAIAPNAVERLVFSASACARNGLDFGVLSRAAERRDLDLHLLLGDTTYNDGAWSRDDFREKWAENLSRPEYRALRARTSVLATWDDHEISNDWSGEDIPPERLRNGIEAFFEHTPVSRPSDAPDRLWRSVRWGLTAEFFVLDGRSERRRDTRETPQAEYLSTAQLEWLEQGLADSPARFKVIVNSVPIGAFPGAFEAVPGDRWVGYAAQRERLLSFIEQRDLSGVFFVSGDFHMASFGAVSRSGPGSGLIEVLAGPVATRSPNPGVSFLARPQFTFATTEPNVGVFNLDPVSGEVHVSWVGSDGAVLAERSFRP